MEIDKEEIKKIIADEVKKIRTISHSNSINTEEKEPDEEEVTIYGKLSLGFFTNNHAYYNIILQTAKTLDLYGDVHLTGFTIHFLLSGKRKNIEKFEIFIKNL